MTLEYFAGQLVEEIKILARQFLRGQTLATGTRGLVARQETMGIVITPYAEEHVAAVKAFNCRLRSGGAELFFPESPVPAWLPKLDGREIYDEYYVAVDDGAVRGGYILKYQPFFVAGRLMPLVQYRLPLSEGFVDKQFAPIGVQMYLDAMRKQPNLYTVGLGGL